MCILWKSSNETQIDIPKEWFDHKDFSEVLQNIANYYKEEPDVLKMIGAKDVDSYKNNTKFPFDKKPLDENNPKEMEEFENTFGAKIHESTLDENSPLMKTWVENVDCLTEKSEKTKDQIVYELSKNLNSLASQLSKMGLSLTKLLEK